MPQYLDQQYRLKQGVAPHNHRLPNGQRVRVTPGDVFRPGAREYRAIADKLEPAPDASLTFGGYGTPEPEQEPENPFASTDFASDDGFEFARDHDMSDQDFDGLVGTGEDGAFRLPDVQAILAGEYEEPNEGEEDTSETSEVSDTDEASSEDVEDQEDINENAGDTPADLTDEDFASPVAFNLWKDAERPDLEAEGVERTGHNGTTFSVSDVRDFLADQE